MLNSLRKLNSTGDTIVEVLIVLAVLSMSFAISYATANRGLAQSRNAEEHSEALGAINSQVELLRAAVAQGTDPTTTAPGESFCIPNPATPTTVYPFTQVPASAATDSANGYPHYGLCTRGLYHISATYMSNGGNPYIDFLVRWDGLGNLGPQQEELSYRVYKLSAAGAAFSDNPVVPPAPPASPPPPPPATCPSGETGTPPLCVPATCPSGETGTPPDCSPPPSCPFGETGTPPDCRPISF